MKRSDRYKNSARNSLLTAGIALVVALAGPCFIALSYQSESAFWLVASIVLTVIAAIAAVYSFGAMAAAYRMAEVADRWEIRNPRFRESAGVLAQSTKI